MAGALTAVQTLPIRIESRMRLDREKSERHPFDRLEPRSQVSRFLLPALEQIRASSAKALSGLGAFFVARTVFRWEQREPVVAGR